MFVQLVPKARETASGAQPTHVHHLLYSILHVTIHQPRASCQVYRDNRLCLHKRERERERERESVCACVLTWWSLLSSSFWWTHSRIPLRLCPPPGAILNWNTRLRPPSGIQILYKQRQYSIITLLENFLVNLPLQILQTTARKMLPVEIISII